MSVEALASAWARTEDAPDGSIVVADSEISGRLRCVVNVTTQLGPGRVEHSVLAVRTHLGGLEIANGPADTKAQLLAALEEQLQAATRLIEHDPLALLEAFNDRCVAMNRRVLVSLLPRGEARGRATAVDKDGFLVLESSTGMLERIAPASLRSIELFD